MSEDWDHPSVPAEPVGGPTPRTDALLDRLRIAAGKIDDERRLLELATAHSSVWSQHARQLERELGEAKQYWTLYFDECIEADVRLKEVEREVAGLRADAERYRHMRKSAEFQSRNGPGLYWYLPRWDRGLPIGERLDSAIDSALKEPKND